MKKIIFTNSRGQSLELGNSAPFILEKIGGTGSPQSTILTSKAPGQDGKTHHGTLLEERIIPIECSVIGNTVEDMYRKRQQLNSIFNPKISGKMIYVNDTGQHAIDCIVESVAPKDPFSNMQEYLIQLYCPNPYWKETEETKEEIALWQGDFCFDLELKEGGIELGHRVSTLIINALNTGDAECGMRIEFKALASVVNPSILNVYTQKFIKVKRTLVAGDKLIVNTEFGNKKVEMVHNGVAANVFNYIDLNSTFFSLDVGDNLLRYDAENGIDNLEVAIYFTPKYVGV